MTRGVLIIGTDAGVGKTLLASALAFAGHSRAMKVGVMKPITTGCEEIDGMLESSDARALAYAAASDIPIDLICPYRYRSSGPPAAAAEADDAAPVDLTEVAEAYRRIAMRSDFVIVEGGGIAEPIAWDASPSHLKDYAGLARILNLDVVIVVGNRPGCINAARLTIHYARSRGVGIIGTILNDCDEVATGAMETTQESLLRMTDVPCLGHLHFKQPVTRDIVDALLARR